MSGAVYSSTGRCAFLFEMAAQWLEQLEQDAGGQVGDDGYSQRRRLVCSTGRGDKRKSQCKEYGKEPDMARLPARVGLHTGPS